MTNILRVSLNDKTVGTLTLFPSGSVFFAFDEAYINDRQRPILSQSFFKPSGEIMPESRSSSGRLPTFFSNLLPEGHGWHIGKRSINVPEMNYMLTAAGRDLISACKESEDTSKIQQP